jgi:hypothetical protein
MTAGEPLADGGNGSPAMGPGTERNQDHAHGHIDGKKGKSAITKIQNRAFYVTEPPVSQIFVPLQ